MHLPQLRPSVVYIRSVCLDQQKVHGIPKLAPSTFSKKELACYTCGLVNEDFGCLEALESGSVWYLQKCGLPRGRALLAYKPYKLSQSGSFWLCSVLCRAWDGGCGQ